MLHGGPAYSETAHISDHTDPHKNAANNKCPRALAWVIPLDFRSINQSVEDGVML